MQGKQQVTKFLSKDGSLPAGMIFMPRSPGYGAKLNRIPPEDVRNDAALLLKSLQKEEELLRPDLLVLNYDLTYLAEMSGCQVQMKEPYVWEVVRGTWEGRVAEWADFSIPVPGKSGRLRMYQEVLAIMKKLTGTPVISMVPTPLTLSRQLAGESFLRKCIEEDEQWEELMDAALYVVSDTVKLFLDSGSDSILFCENLTGLETLGSRVPNTLTDFYRTLYNILRHYQKRAIFCIYGKQPIAVDVYRHEMVAGICFSELNPEEIELHGFEQGRPVLGSGLSKQCWDTHGDFGKCIADHLDHIDNSMPFIFSPVITADALPERVLSLVQEVHSCNIGGSRS